MQYYEGKLNHLWVDLLSLTSFRKQGGSRIYPAAPQEHLPSGYGTPVSSGFLQIQPVPQAGGMGGGSAVGKLIPMKLIFRMQHAAALKDKHGRSSLRYYSNYQPDYLYVTIQKEWCEEITDIEFAGETLMASKHAHEVLTWVYGDYMKLPPEAERVPAHSTIDIQVFDEEA